MTVYNPLSVDCVWEQDVVTGTGSFNLGSTAGAGGFRTLDQAYTAGALPATFPSPAMNKNVPPISVMVQF